MMPGIGLNSGAVDVATDPIHVPKQGLFDDNNDDKDPKSERGRTVMRRTNLANTFYRQTKRCAEHAKRDNGRRNRFSFAVPIRMGLVRRTSGKFQPSPNR